MEQHSRLILCNWATCCLADAAACRSHPELAQFHLPLNFRDLWRLSLSDGAATTALRAVCDYLRHRTAEGAMLRPVFSLRIDDATLNFAKAVGASLTSLAAAWEAETFNAKERIDRHWAAVLTQQEAARKAQKDFEEVQHKVDLAAAEVQFAPDGHDPNEKIYDAALFARLDAEEKAAAKAEGRKQVAVPEEKCKRDVTDEEKASFIQKTALKKALDVLMQELSEAKARLEAALKCPPPVYQPLPSDRAEGLAVLLFLHMQDAAPALSHLSRLCFVAQESLQPMRQPLAPAPKKPLEKPRTKTPWTSWAEYHKAHQAWRSRSPSHPVKECAAGAHPLLVTKVPDPKPAELLRPSVLDLHSEIESVHYPKLDFSLVWDGERDPFGDAAAADEVATGFAEQLPHHACAPTGGTAPGPLSWAMVAEDEREAENDQGAPASLRARGGRGVAEQRDRPEWLTRSEFVAFAGVRASPRLQLRNICCVLRDRSLPFAHPGVQLLLRQALYHVGTISAAKVPTELGAAGDAATSATQLEWKAELAVRGPGSVVDVLQRELRALCSDLGESGGAGHEALLAVIDAAVYLRQWDVASADAVLADCARVTARRARAGLSSRAAGSFRKRCLLLFSERRSLCHRVSSAPSHHARPPPHRSWTNNLRERLDAAVDPARSRHLRWLLSVFGLYGILACGGTEPLPPGNSAVTGLCAAAVQAQAYALDDNTNTVSLKAKEWRAALQARCDTVMATRAGEVLAAIAADPRGGILALALQAAPKKVTELLPPPNAAFVVSWSPLGLNGAPTASPSPIGCYEATVSTGDRITINALTGVVLIDGWPPSALPELIRKHRLYERVFGDRDFEVVRGGDHNGAGGGGTTHTTIHHLAERHFSFTEAPVTIRELSSKAEDTLELLDPWPEGVEAKVADWAADLPEWILKQHSHWLNRAQGVVLMRPLFGEVAEEEKVAGAASPRPPRALDDKGLSERSWDVVFVVIFQGQTAGRGPGASSLGRWPPAAPLPGGGDLCVPVPAHLRQRPWQDLAREAGSSPPTLLLNWALVLWGDRPPPSAQTPAAAAAPPLPLMPGRQVIAAFEGSESFIDWFLDRCSSSPAEPQFRVKLPRFGNLAFDLRCATSASGRGTFVSVNFEGYRLAPEQQLSDTLPGFARYLVLEPGPELRKKPPWTPPATKILVPAGEVDRRKPTGFWAKHRTTTIATPADTKDGTFKEIAYHAFEIHPRFRDLRASTPEARLQLAALYAATDRGRGVPDRRLGMTGAEAAMGLVRGSFLNRPLSKAERVNCEAAASFAEHAECPALFLLCHLLQTSAVQVDFLHPRSLPPPSPSSETLRDLTTNKAAYAHYVRAGSCNPRRLLTPEEEEQALSHRAGPQPPPARPLAPRAAAVVTVREELLVAASEAGRRGGFVDDCELRLLQLVSYADNAAAPHPQPFPLSDGSIRLGVLGREVLDELRKSWDVNEGLSAPMLRADLRADPSALVAHVREDLKEARRLRGLVEELLLEEYWSEANLPPEQDPGLGWRVPGARLLRVAGRAPKPTLTDFVRALWSPAHLVGLAAFVALSDTDQARIRDATLAWLKLAILEDKLGRLEAMALAAAASGGSSGLEDIVVDVVKELLCQRTWDPAESPEWLAFEADGESPPPRRHRS